MFSPASAFSGLGSSPVFFKVECVLAEVELLAGHGRFWQNARHLSTETSIFLQVGDFTGGNIMFGASSCLYSSQARGTSEKSPAVSDFPKKSYSYISNNNNV